jgi:tight adherence protein C
MNELSQRLRLHSGERANCTNGPALWRSWFSSFNSAKTQRELLQELPDAIELIAAVLGSGVGHREAFIWVSARCSGQIKLELAQLVDTLGVGDSTSQSLLDYESTQKHPALRELALKLALSEQLGTSVTNQMVSLATALRGEAYSDFRKVGSKKETHLLMPLVFLVLPVTVLFALYPSVQFLQFGSI